MNPRRAAILPAAAQAEARAALRELQLAADAAVRCGADPAGLLRDAAPDVPARLQVYRHAFVARLVDALRDNHAVLARALGDTGFDALARAYLAAHPSGFTSIRWFGDRLAGFMRDRAAAGDPCVPHPAFADLAAMDWALRGAFDAADAGVLTHEALAALPPERWPGLRFDLHPSVRLVPLDWAVEAAWRALDAFEPAAGEPEPEMPEPTPLAHVLLVWRDGLETRWRSLPADEARLLRALVSGEDFASLCERAAETHAAQAAAHAAGALGGWVAEGLLSRAI